MPVVGSIYKGSDLGMKGGKYIWARCPDCDVERWAQYAKDLKSTSIRRCKPCAINYNKAGFQIRHK